MPVAIVRTELCAPEWAGAQCRRCGALRHDETRRPIERRVVTEFRMDVLDERFGPCGGLSILKVKTWPQAPSPRHTYRIEEVVSLGDGIARACKMVSPDDRARSKTLRLPRLVGCIGERGSFCRFQVEMGHARFVGDGVVVWPVHIAAIQEFCHS